MITEQQYQEMKARFEARMNRSCAKAPEVVDVDDAVAKEMDLHQDIIKRCRENGWIYFHGSMAHKTHRTLGECDFTCLLPNGRVLFVECKGAKTKTSPEQLAMAAWMRKLGHGLHILRSMREFDDLCRRILSGESLEALK